MKLLAHFLFLIRSNRVLVLKGTRQLATARVYYSGAKIYQGGVKGRGNGVGVEVGGRRGGEITSMVPPTDVFFFQMNRKRTTSETADRKHLPSLTKHTPRLIDSPAALCRLAVCTASVA